MLLYLEIIPRSLPGRTTHCCSEICDADASFHLELLKCVRSNQIAWRKPGLHTPFILLTRMYSSAQRAVEQPERERESQKEVKYVKYMQVMKMHASSESVRQLIKSRLCLRRGSRLAYIWYSGTLTNGISTWNQLSFSVVWLSSLWGSLCSNKFLIARAPVFLSLFLSLYCNVNVNLQEVELINEWL